MKLKLLTLSILSLLAGCASSHNNYQLYADTQKAIAQANAVAETARYNALTEIAKNGDNAAKIAAILSIHIGSGGQKQPQQIILPPGN